MSGGRPVQRVSLDKVPPRGRENIEESLLTPVSVEKDGESIFFRPRKQESRREPDGAEENPINYPVISPIPYFSLLKQVYSPLMPIQKTDES